MSLEAVLGRQLLHNTYFACSRMCRRLSRLTVRRDYGPIHWSWYWRNVYIFGLQKRQWKWRRVVRYTFPNFPEECATACNRIQTCFVSVFPLFVVTFFCFADSIWNSIVLTLERSYSALHTNCSAQHRAGFTKRINCYMRYIDSMHNYIYIYSYIIS